jgi:hypothetical protein
VTVDRVNGTLDPLAGHGTFLAGIVRQHCPSATLISAPVMYGDGAADEGDLLAALTDLYAYHLLACDGRIEGRPIDVISLSMGYYAESPGAVVHSSALAAVLKAFGDAGVSVVAAAGNDATTTPFYPAGLAAGGGGTVPLLAVGATDPGQALVSVYSNTGSWVTAYRPATNVVSTMPTTFNAAARAGLSTNAGVLPARAAVDVDDYSCGFAVWSGTSFAAPALAGDIAAALGGGAGADVDGRRHRLVAAVQSCLGGVS